MIYKVIMMLLDGWNEWWWLTWSAMFAGQRTYGACGGVEPTLGLSAAIVSVRP
jgi:hypothetical protein